MRQDQPALQKQFNTLAKTVRELQYNLALAEEEIAMQDELINDMGEENLNLEQEVHIANIEYGRLLLGKAPLTIRFHVLKELSKEIAAI
jgi:hypothetical protein